MNQVEGKKILSQIMEIDNNSYAGITNLLITFLGVLVIVCFFQFMHVNVFGHDDFYYIDNYGWAIPEEGRWLNYLVFPVARFTPQKFAIFLTYISFFIYILICAVQLVNKRIALVTALSGLLVCPFYTLLQFPTTLLPSNLALALFAYCKWAYPQYDYRKFLLAAGVVFCGLYNNFYNFMPLLFLSDILNGRIKFWKFICWYIAGFIFGFLISELACYLFCGRLIKAALWRNAQYIHTIGDVLRNVRIEYDAFCSDLMMAGKWPIMIAFTSLLISFYLHARQRFQNFGARAAVSIIIACVMLSVYIQAVPLGIVGGHRTAGPLYAALVLLIMVCFYKKTILACLALTLVSLPMFVTDYKSVIYIKTVGNIYFDNLKKIDLDPNLYKLVFLIEDAELKMAEERISQINGFYSHPAFYNMDNRYSLRSAGNAAGFKSAVINIEENQQLRDEINQEAGPWHKNEFYAYRLIGDLLAVKLAWP